MTMSKFLIWSDIHEEFEDFDLSAPSPEGVDALLVAGDIWTKGRSVKKLERIAAWAGVPVIATAGNHDYYGDNIMKSDQRMARQAEESAYDIRFLNPGTTQVNDVRIIGATLWTDYRLRCPTGDNWIVRNACQTVMNDHKRIRWGFGSFRPVSADDLAGIHLQHKTYIAGKLAEPHDGPTLVMTHHAPSGQSVKYRSTEELHDHAYASNLDDMILDTQPDYWIHGHTHNPESYHIGVTKVLANPKGYPGDNPDFNKMKVFDIGRPEHDVEGPCP